MEVVESRSRRYPLGGGIMKVKIAIPHMSFAKLLEPLEYAAEAAERIHE